MNSKNTEYKSLQIHCATASNISAWLRLVQRVAAEFPGFQLDEYKIALEQCIAQKSALLAEIDGAMAGVLLFSREKRELSFLAILPEFRRFGVASALIQEMLLKMPEGDVSVTTFCAEDPNGTPARALYRKFGFVPAEICREFDYAAQRFVLPASARVLKSNTKGGCV